MLFIPPRSDALTIHPHPFPQVFASTCRQGNNFPKREPLPPQFELVVGSHGHAEI